MAAPAAGWVYALADMAAKANPMSAAKMMIVFIKV